MTFFKLPPLPKPLLRQHRWPPEWYRPDDYLGQPLPMQTTLARSSNVILTIRHLLAYRHGIEFELESTTLNEPDGPEDLGGFVGLPYYSKKSPDPSKLPDGLFRFGVQFPDGSKVTTVRYYQTIHTERPKEPVLQSVGSGHVGGRRQVAGYWLWPLPSTGNLIFVCEWPALGIPFTRHEIDTTQIRDAAQKSQPLWPGQA